MQAIFKRLFRIQEMILLLSLTALACLPIALSELVRDAGLSLLLPITLIGVILAWALAGLGRAKIIIRIYFIVPWSAGFIYSHWSDWGAHYLN